MNEMGKMLKKKYFAENLGHPIHFWFLYPNSIDCRNVFQREFFSNIENKLLCSYQKINYN